MRHAPLRRAEEMPEPRSWLQDLALAIEVFAPALALVVFGLRIYIRIKLKHVGWGEFDFGLVILLPVWTC